MFKQLKTIKSVTIHPLLKNLPKKRYHRSASNRLQSARVGIPREHYLHCDKRMLHLSVIKTAVKQK